MAASEAGKRLVKLIGSATLILYLAGCANYGTPKNVEIKDPRAADIYSLRDWVEKHSDDEIRLIVTFSGGGTRASALSYGVMEELRDTRIKHGNDSVRLLDEIDYISSVSGGSFTSAYYGLHGDDIFVNFKKDFLSFNLESHLFWRAFDPFLLFSKKGRTEAAIKYYQKFLFHDATFADMIKENHPMIIINASDLGHGIRFSFIQEYFDLLCSELSAYPVADAVAASSAVPVLFNPVVVKNYAGCKGEDLLGPDDLQRAQSYYSSGDLPAVISQLETYEDKNQRKYVHFVDGGITDNLGLRAITDISALTGDPNKYYGDKWQPPKQLVVIAVNAATRLNDEMDLSNKEPSAVHVAGAVTKLQLGRYDTDSKLLVGELLDRWAKLMSTPGHKVETHLINVDIQDIKDTETLNYVNSIPTSFKLDEKQVDTLIESGRQLLRTNPEFQKLLESLNGK